MEGLAFRKSLQGQTVPEGFEVEKDFPRVEAGGSFALRERLEFEYSRTTLSIRETGGNLPEADPVGDRKHLSCRDLHSTDCFGASRKGAESEKREP